MSTEIFKSIEQKQDEILLGQKSAKQEAETFKGEVNKSIEGVTKSVEIVTKSVETIDGEVKAVAKEVEIIKRDSAKVIETTKKAKEVVTLEGAIKAEVEKNFDEIEKIARKDNGRQQHLVLDLKTVGDITVANVTGGTAWAQVGRDGIILNPDRKRHMRELIPTGTVGAGTDYAFMRENGAGEGNPAPVAEGAQKPFFDADLVESSVKIETIAGLVRVTRRAMSNVPGFISYLQTMMPKRLLKVEDSQILYGDGTTPNIKGILTSGNYVAGDATATTLIERILNDISTLEDTYERDATGIAMRPATYNSLFLNRAAGSGEFDLPQNVTFVNGQLFIMGLPVIKTTALNSSDFIVGDFTGAQFLIQEGMRLEFFEQDADNVQKNKVTIRIEETVALPVFGSNYFIKGVTADPA